MNKIQEVSGGQWHWLMRLWGALPCDGGRAELRAACSNAGYGIVKVAGEVIGLVTRYDYDNPRYFIDAHCAAKVGRGDSSTGQMQSSIAMVI